jgi:glycine cleavage system H lipoate-binding protein
MAYIEKFLGKRVEIPEDRRYVIKPGLWAKAEGPDVRFGLTEPELVLAGGVNDLEWLVWDGEEVEQGQSIAIVITGKIKYIDAPLAGVLGLNPKVKEATSLIVQDPYEQGWLFQIRTGSETKAGLEDLYPAEAYVESLQNSEGCKNPEGIKGGVSGICKAVYTGIKEQKF